MCIVASLEDPASDEADECVIPIFNEFADAEFPGFVKPCFEETVRQARDRFCQDPFADQAGLSSDRHCGVSSKSPTQRDTSTLPAKNSCRSR